jgi:arabinofuranosyltransferase
MAATLATALLCAWRARWTSDDAYIVFRYASNLADGHGLVFNAGERVEGYTCFLWTVWCGLGAALGVVPERWSNLSSIACALGTVAVLFRLHLFWRTRLPLAVPFAAVAAALHPDLAIFATGGLETAAYTFLIIAGCAALVCGPPSARRLAGAAALFALGALTRADGVLPAAAAGVWLLARTRRLRPALIFGGVLALIYVPYFLWRWRYYGDLYPNTYYVKSGGAAWYGQGLFYLYLYLKLYWALPLLIILAGWAALELRRTEPAGETSGALALFLLVGLSYAFYVVRVGGDFMFARLLLPCTVPLLAAAEAALGHAATQAPRAMLVAAAVAVVGPLGTPRPIGRVYAHSSGIAEEARFYADPAQIRRTDHQSQRLRRVAEGLPLRLVVFGAEAKIAFRTGFPVVVEADGLTDRTIAHQPLTTRGRPGHEKLASPAYLVTERRMHLLLDRTNFDAIKAGAYIPAWPIDFGEGVSGYLLHWDPDLLAALRARGARFQDFPAYLDRYLADLDSLPPEQVKADLARFRHFYFQLVSDGAREQPLVRRSGSLAAAAR